MAKQATGNPIIFDAATQGEGYGPNEDSISTLFNTPIYVKRFVIKTGDGGDVQIDDRATSGKEVLFLDETFATDYVECPIGVFVKGVYIKTLPANAKVYLYHGKV